MIARALTALLPLLAIGCQKGEVTTYERFNGEDVLSIEVGVDEELAAVETELSSNTGEVAIGWATLSPGGGPAGTLHTLVVDVYDDYQDIVDRASVRTSSGDRGEDEFDLERDYADEGLFKLEVQSVADEGETRTDTFTIHLWDAVSGDTG